MRHVTGKIYALYYLLYMKSRFSFIHTQNFSVVFLILFILFAELGMQILLYDVLSVSYTHLTLPTICSG